MCINSCNTCVPMPCMDLYEIAKSDCPIKSHEITYLYKLYVNNFICPHIHHRVTTKFG